MTGAYFGAFHAGETHAIERMIDFYGGTGTFAAWPQRVRDYAAKPPRSTCWIGPVPTAFPLRPLCWRRVATPTLVVWGETSHPAAKRANQLLGHCIPGAVVATMAGAAHFMITTHAKQLAELIAQHMARQSFSLSASGAR